MIYAFNALRPRFASLFIVENKQLKLLEHAGAKEPVLVLEAEHCVTTANDTTREFVIVFHVRHCSRRRWP